MSASETVWRIARQFDSIRHRSPTVIEAKDINQPTNQPTTAITGNRLLAYLFIVYCTESCLCSVYVCLQKIFGLQIYIIIRMIRVSLDNCWNQTWEAMAGVFLKETILLELVVSKNRWVCFTVYFNNFSLFTKELV